MASMKKTQTTNKVLFDIIRDLSKYSTETGVKVYRAVANKLSATASQRAQVNVGHIDRVATEGEVLIVPGKILGDGQISKKVTVVAFSASEGAKVKIEAAGGKFLTIKEHLATKPDNKVRIIG